MRGQPRLSRQGAHVWPLHSWVPLAERLASHRRYSTPQAGWDARLLWYGHGGYPGQARVPAMTMKDRFVVIGMIPGMTRQEWQERSEAELIVP
jgi:hypothetical protein